MRSRWKSGAAAFFFLCGCMQAVAKPAVLAPQAERFVLANGMEVVVIPDHRAPLVTHMVWYRVGAADDPSGKSGLAHFLEHLMFKGTQKNPAGAFVARLGTIGGQQNATTSKDYTHYYQRAHKTYLAELMAFEADRMHGLTLTADLVRTERDVVLAERQERMDQNPQARLGVAIDAALYQNSHYGIPVIGWQHEIEQLDLNDALSFYRKYYAPNNAILIVAGDVTVADVRGLAEKIYGPLAPSATLDARAEVRRREPPALAERCVNYEDAQVAEPALYRQFIVPSFTGDPAQAAALEVLAGVLGGGTGRFYRRLVVDKKIAVRAGASYDSAGFEGGEFTLYATFKPSADSKTVEAEMDALLRDAASQPVEAGAFEHIKRAILAEALYLQDNHFDLANTFGLRLTSGESFDALRNWPLLVDAVSVQDVQMAAQALLQSKAYVIGTLKPPAKPEANRNKNP